VTQATNIERARAAIDASRPPLCRQRPGRQDAATRRSCGFRSNMQDMQQDSLKIGRGI